MQEYNPFTLQVKIINFSPPKYYLWHINIKENIIGRHKFNKGHTIVNDLQLKKSRES